MAPLSSHQMHMALFVLVTLNGWVVELSKIFLGETITEQGTRADGRANALRKICILNGAENSI